MGTGDTCLPLPRGQSGTQGPPAGQEWHHPQDRGSRSGLGTCAARAFLRIPRRCPGKDGCRQCHGPYSEVKVETSCWQLTPAEPEHHQRQEITAQPSGTLPSPPAVEVSSSPLHSENLQDCDGDTSAAGVPMGQGGGSEDSMSQDRPAEYPQHVDDAYPECVKWL